MTGHRILTGLGNRENPGLLIFWKPYNTYKIGQMRQFAEYTKNSILIYASFRSYTCTYDNTYEATISKKFHFTPTTIRRPIGSEPFLGGGDQTYFGQRMSDFFARSNTVGV